MIKALEVVVLAGGSGTRLWPLSRRARPKPFLPLAGGTSMLKRAVALGRRISGSENVCLVAGSTLLRRIRGHLGRAGRLRSVLEPAPRNTAAALALAAALCHRRRGPVWLLCLPADQWIREPGKFARLVRRIATDAVGEWLITFGVQPKYPHTGYGYIRLGTELRSGLRRAARFVEKPPAAVVARYLRSGHWVWNSGMFLWRSDTFLEEVRRLMPSVARAVSDITEGGAERRRVGLRRWRALPSISVDHGILERTRRVAVAPCSIGWCDLGSWDVVASVLPRAADGARHVGVYRSVNGGDCLVYAPRHLTLNLGVRGAGLVVTSDAILLFDRSKHQSVREAVALLERDPGLARYL